MNKFFAALLTAALLSLGSAAFAADTATAAAQKTVEPTASVTPAAPAAKLVKKHHYRKHHYKKHHHVMKTVLKSDDVAAPAAK